MRSLQWRRLQQQIGDGLPESLFAALFASRHPFASFRDERGLDRLRDTSGGDEERTNDRCAPDYFRILQHCRISVAKALCADNPA